MVFAIITLGWCWHALQYLKLDRHNAGRGHDSTGSRYSHRSPFRTVEAKGWFINLIQSLWIGKADDGGFTELGLLEVVFMHTECSHQLVNGNSFTDAKCPWVLEYWNDFITCCHIMLGFPFSVSICCTFCENGWRDDWRGRFKYQN